jgi:hypothetical protein
MANVILKAPHVYATAHFDVVEVKQVLQTQAFAS